MLSEAADAVLPVREDVQRIPAVRTIRSSSQGEQFELPTVCTEPTVMSSSDSRQLSLKCTYISLLLKYSQSGCRTPATFS